MKNKKAKKEKLVENIADQVEIKSTEYEPTPLKDLNWKRIIIVFFIIASIITGVTLAWYYGAKGGEYLNYKETANAIYKSLLLDLDDQKVSQFSYINDDLKLSANGFVMDLKAIYASESDADSKGLHSLTSYGNVEKYRYNDKRELQIGALGKTDYLFAFVDAKLSDEAKIVSENNKDAYVQVFSKWLGERVLFRVTNDKISAIGLTFENPANEENSHYRWLNGSYTEGMVGH